jgi:uncharacterized alkaline shock family protein YloU
MSDHRFSINIPDQTYKALRIKADYESKTIKDIILFCVKEILGDAKISDDEVKNNLAFLGRSGEVFLDEWNSKEDEKVFSHLQKYKPKS